MRAEQQPGRIAYAFISDSGEEDITYAELDCRARAIGCMLADQRLAGAPVLLLYPPGIDYIAAFFGCLYANVIAVPAYMPDQERLENSRSRLAAIVRDAMPSGVLTSAAAGTALSAMFEASPELSGLRIMVTDDVSEDQAWQPAAVAAESIALLQYTSGATSNPKGVILTHRNLMSNSEIIFRLFGHSGESRGMIWLPPYHDMGLVGGIIQPLYGGFPVTLMAPAEFLRRPLSWLQEISRIQATTSGGPDFAYDLCVRKTTEEERSQLDLSSWRVAFNGSEPVRAETMENFARAFEPAGFQAGAFHPCYGLAEATLLVTGGIPWSEGGTSSFDTAALRSGRVVPGTVNAASRRLVSCGSAAPDHRVVIVDPSTRAECATGEIGEIWISGSSAARSYWRRPEEARGILGARLADSGEESFVRSGDLGFTLDNQLYVTGRIKDLIIVRGRSHHPQDIEYTAECSSPVLRAGRGAAFTVADYGQERLVIAYEVNRQAGAVNVGVVAGAIRAAVAAEHQLQVHTVVLLAPGRIPKTSSGKIQRRFCAALFEQGKLVELGRSAFAYVPESVGLHLDLPGLLAVPAGGRQGLLREYLRRLVASACQIDSREVATDAPLLALGVDSCAMVRIQHSIETDLGAHLTASDLAHAATLEDLAIRLNGQLEIAAAALQPGIGVSREQRPLWFLPEIEPGTAEHSIAIALRFRGELDVSALEHAVDALVARQAGGDPLFQAGGDPLFQAGGDPAVQRIAGLHRAWLREKDASGADEAQLAEWLECAAREPFDLASGPLLRIHLYRGVMQETVLLVVTHHVIADFWSLKTFVRELEMLYAEQTGGVCAALPELTDFVRHYSWISGSRVSVHAALSP
jgi:acyl-CoA synthetase (AMP-forming)/AMP-acid ligase II/aryl carrier-like protein